MRGFFHSTIIGLAALGLIAACADSSFTAGDSKKKPPSSLKDADANGDGFADGSDGSGADGNNGHGDGSDGGGGTLPDGTPIPSGSGPGNGQQNPNVPGQFIQKFKQGNSFVVDVLMVFDTSTSMREEKEFIEANMAKFINDLNSAALDAKVTVIGKKTNATDPKNMGLTFNFPANLPADKFAQVDQYVHSTDAIGHLNRYFAGQLAQPIPPRDGVPTEVIIVTDDNGHNTSNNPYKVPRSIAAEFTMPANRKIVVDAVVGLQKGKSANPKCVIENVGTEHMTLANQTGGTVFDLCSPDWNNLLKALTDKIVARNGGFALDKIPDTAQKIEVYVNGKLVSSNNYTIDPVNRLVKFKDTYILPNGAEVVVKYYEKV